MVPDMTIGVPNYESGRGRSINLCKEASAKMKTKQGGTSPKYFIIYIICLIEGSLEAKLPTIWTDGKAQPGRSSGMEKVKREKIRDGEDKRWRR